MRTQQIRRHNACLTHNGLVRLSNRLGAFDSAFGGAARCPHRMVNGRCDGILVDQHHLADALDARDLQAIRRP